MALASCFLFLSAPVAADHPQTGPNDVTVRFDHDGDNEWWVEVLTRSSNGFVAAMEVRAESSSTFRGLQNKGTVDGWTKWGPEQAFQIPPGDRVMFRAHTVNEASGTVDSCFFTHPEGVEQCTAPRPPPEWQVKQIGEAGTAGFRGDMATGDADNDGIRDVTIGRDGVYTFEKTAGTWSGKRVGSMTPIGALAVGNADENSGSEIYAVSDSMLVKYRFAEGTWIEQPLVTFPERSAGDMTLGDIDGQTGREMYVGMYDTTCDPDTRLCTSDSSVYHVSQANGVWTSTPIASLSGHLDSMWIGDGDSDGDVELYVGHGTRHADRTTQIQKVGGTWHANELPASGSESGFALVVAGDGDRDGRSEVYVLNYEGLLRKMTHGSSGWTDTRIISEVQTPGGTPLFPHSLFLGDGDADGSQELYVGTDSGGVYQVRFTEGAWRSIRIADFHDAERDASGSNGMIVVGDGDGDVRAEVYAGVSFDTTAPSDDGVTRVYQIKAPSSSFDATFTGVRGNEWWAQADVKTAGGTLSKVDVRLDDGAWKPLAKQSWGANAYAASYHIPEGTIVQLRATSTTGATDLSDCYRWIPPSGQNAAKTTCGSAPPPPSDFDATFRTPGGNEWWVEVYVEGNEPIASVHARDDGGTWIALEKKSWGAWAKSFHVEDGSIVEFRATSADGDTDISGGYRWPSGTPA